MFAKEGGPQALLSLTQRSGFRGFASLVTLLFKHCLEDGLVLRHAMEGVIRASVTNPYYNSKEIRPQAMGGRELYYVMRKLGPCACRDPQLFMELASSSIRLCSELPSPTAYSASQRSPTTLVKCVPPPKVEHVPLNPVQSALVNLLIDHLCAEETCVENKGAEEKTAAAAAEVKMDEEGEVPRAMHFDDSRRGRVRRGSYRRQLTTGTYDDDDVNSEDMAVDGEEGGGGSRIASSLGVATASSSPTGDREAGGSGAKTESGRDQPLMSKAAILRLLSELVESYPSCAKLIAESSRKVKVNGKPPKDMTVLAFIFDHLLPASSNTTGKVPPIAKLSKTFIQCLAVSHPSPEIISLLVTEFKHALTRALSLPESTSKHNRIRALTGLLSQISDYITAARGALNPSHFARLLIRKGFISDLARAVHNLSLSSPMLSGTVNSILKPLEVLTKMVNQVAAASKKADVDKGTPLTAGTAGGQGAASGGGSLAAPVPAQVEYQGTNQVTITVDAAPSGEGGSGGGGVAEGQSHEGTSQSDARQEEANAQISAVGMFWRERCGVFGGRGMQGAPHGQGQGGVACRRCSDRHCDLGHREVTFIQRLPSGSWLSILPLWALRGSVGFLLKHTMHIWCLYLMVMCIDLEATHESLIPLEEEGEEEDEEATAMETELLDQVVNLARDLGRSHGLRGMGGGGGVDIPRRVSLWC